MTRVKRSKNGDYRMARRIFLKELQEQGLGVGLKGKQLKKFLDNKWGKLLPIARENYLSVVSQKK